MDANMQLNSFRQLFPDKIFFPDIYLTFSKVPDFSLTAVKFPDVSRFSRQVVTLKTMTVQMTVDLANYIAIISTIFNY